MTNVTVRATPAFPGCQRSLNSTFVHTCASPIDRESTFFSLDAGRWLAVATARLLLNLPYFHASMNVERRGDGLHHHSRRRSTAAEFTAVYHSEGAPFTASCGSLEYFLTERYCLYHQSRRGVSYRLDIHHPPWPLQLARASITTNTMAAASGLTIERTPATLHFASRQDVIAWAPVPV